MGINKNWQFWQISYKFYFKITEFMGCFGCFINWHDLIYQKLCKDDFSWNKFLFVYKYLLDSGFMANVYCSDESAICTPKEFDENSIKNLEDLQIKIGSSSLQYHIQNKIM